MSCKKKLYWQSSFGKIEVIEQTFLKQNNNKLFRPFSLFALVLCRGYSTRLQRILTDFGAEESFKKATKKVFEHYRIVVPASTTRLKVEAHAKKMQIMNKDNFFKSDEKKVERIIAQADGGMVPLVKTQQAPAIEGVKIDRRKNKELFWKEGLLSFARGHKRVTQYFYASLGSRDEVGKQIAKCALLAGRGEKTHIHCLGDGAQWIAEAVEKEFGSDANFTLDFYHLTQYLSGAAQCIQKDYPLGWVEKQKTLILENKTEEVFQALQEHINSKEQCHEGCLAEKCYNYMDKRRKYLNYKDALENGLPIGSGEIESGIRSIVHSRLKKPGAWWCLENADAMLSLTTVRENGFWDQYWKESSRKGLIQFCEQQKYKNLDQYFSQPNCENLAQC
jgi:hypothetical protein